MSLLEGISIVFIASDRGAHRRGVDPQQGLLGKASFQLLEQFKGVLYGPVASNDVTQL